MVMMMIDDHVRIRMHCMHMPFTSLCIRMDYLQKSNHSGSHSSFYTHRHRNYHTLASHSPHKMGVAHHDHESTGPHQHHRNIAYNKHQSVKMVVGKPRGCRVAPLEEEALEPVQEASLQASASQLEVVALEPAQEASLQAWAFRLEEEALEPVQEASLQAWASPVEEASLQAWASGAVAAVRSQCS